MCNMPKPQMLDNFFTKDKRYVIFALSKQYALISLLVIYVDTRAKDENRLYNAERKQYDLLAVDSSRLLIINVIGQLLSS